MSGITPSKKPEPTPHHSYRVEPAKTSYFNRFAPLAKEMLANAKLYHFYPQSTLANFKRKIFKVFEGVVNALTIISGSRKRWDQNRLLQGKHVDFHLMGAEHVQITSKTGDLVDAHYLAADSLLKKLEELGGKKKCLRIERADKPQASTPPFPAFVFKKPPADFNLVVKTLRQCGLDNSGWDYIKNEDTLYLCRKKDAFSLSRINFHSKTNPTQIVEMATPSTKQGETASTVLLSNPQRSIYENELEKTLTYALEGLNVMLYNPPGKGLSTGLPDRDNINASIEAAYDFISKVKRTKDDQILAQGTCFGAAPTAWLGAQHPKINLFLDQSPANFVDAANYMFEEEKRNIIDQLEEMKHKAEVPKKADIASPEEGDEEEPEDTVPLLQKAPQPQQPLQSRLRNDLLSWSISMIATNLSISSLAKTFLSGYDIPELLQSNRGNTLFNLNVKSSRGEGGDDVVPPEHPEMMLDALADTEGRQVRFAFNPGGTHTSEWWTSAESTDAVIGFLENTGLIPKMGAAFQQGETSPPAARAETTKMATLKDLFAIDAKIERLTQAKGTARAEEVKARVTLLMKQVERDKKGIFARQNDLAEQYENAKKLKEIYEISKQIRSTLLPKGTSKAHRAFIASIDGLSLFGRPTLLKALHRILNHLHEGNLDKISESDLAFAQENLPKLRDFFREHPDLYPAKSSTPPEEWDQAIGLLKSLAHERLMAQKITFTMPAFHSKVFQELMKDQIPQTDDTQQIFDHVISSFGSDLAKTKQQFTQEEFLNLVNAAVMQVKRIYLLSQCAKTPLQTTVQVQALPPSDLEHEQARSILMHMDTLSSFMHAICIAGESALGKAYQGDIDKLASARQRVGVLIASIEPRFPEMLQEAMKEAQRLQDEFPHGEDELNGFIRALHYYIPLPPSTPDSWEKF